MELDNVIFLCLWFSDAVQQRYGTNVLKLQSSFALITDENGCNKRKSKREKDPVNKRYTVELYLLSLSVNFISRLTEVSFSHPAKCLGPIEFVIRVKIIITKRQCNSSISV